MTHILSFHSGSIILNHHGEILHIHFSFPMRTKELNMIIKNHSWYNITLIIFLCVPSLIQFQYFDNIFLITKYLEWIVPKEQVIGSWSLSSEVAKHGEVSCSPQAQIGIHSKEQEEADGASACNGFGELYMDWLGSDILVVVVCVVATVWTPQSIQEHTCPQNPMPHEDQPTF